MKREEIKEILPHREPMLLVDEVVLNEDGSATGYYKVRGDEFFLQGHFPGNPIVPGVIQCEMSSRRSYPNRCKDHSRMSSALSAERNRIRRRKEMYERRFFFCHIR